MSNTVAALYVATGGVYYGLFDVDPWDTARDARLYPGPHAVIAHPPCARWGRYWYGGPSARVRRAKGDDGGCFSAALASVRAWGGVLEHPAGSAAWQAFGLLPPPVDGGWVPAGDFRGWTCHVEQGHYGHRARKATWLYAVTPGSFPPPLTWGRAQAALGPRSGRDAERERRCGAVARMSHRERAATPVVFRDVLLAIARVRRMHE